MDGEDAAAAAAVVDVFLGDRVVLSFFVSAVDDRLAGTALLLLLLLLLFVPVMLVLVLE
jgi:hypothetical protein